MRKLWLRYADELLPQELNSIGLLCLGSTQAEVTNANANANGTPGRKAKTAPHRTASYLDVEPPTAFRVSTAAACIVAPAPAPPLISIHTSLKESLVPHLLHSVRDKGRSRNRIASAPYSTVQYSTYVCDILHLHPVRAIPFLSGPHRHLGWPRRSAPPSFAPTYAYSSFPRLLCQVGQLSLALRPGSCSRHPYCLRVEVAYLPSPPSLSCVC